MIIVLSFILKMQSTLPFKPIHVKQENSNLLNVWTWNINCIKNKKSLVEQLLKKHDVDILFLTETKIQEKDKVVFNHYTCIWNCNQTSYYHGVAFIYKSHLNVTLLTNALPHETQIINHFTDSKNNQMIKKYVDKIEGEISKAHHTEGRLLAIQCDQIIIVGTYSPNSGVNKNEPLKRLAYRTLAWDKDLHHYLNQLKEHHHVIWTGDLNVIMKDNDVLNVKANIAGTTEEERTNMETFMVDWIDAWDTKNNVQKSR